MCFRNVPSTCIVVLAISTIAIPACNKKNAADAPPARSSGDAAGARSMAKPAPAGRVSGDYNGDGKVDGDDIQYVLQQIASDPKHSPEATQRASELARMLLEEGPPASAAPPSGGAPRSSTTPQPGATPQSGAGRTSGS